MRTAVVALAVGAVVAPAAWFTGRLRGRYVLVTVVGRSMTPTFAPGDLLLARRRIGVVSAGDVVVVGVGVDVDTSPAGGRVADGRPALIVKRVAAAAGDPVPKQDLPSLALVPETVVPAGKLVLLGDNAASTDSRHFGYVDTRQVAAVVTRRVRAQHGGRA